MKQSRACSQCGASMAGFRSDKRECSPACKQVSKRAYDIASYASIRDKKIEVACKWQRDNKEAKQAYDSARRSTVEVRAQRNELERQWRLDHIEQANADSAMRQRKRRATKVGNGVYLVTERDFRRCLSRYGNACAYCHQAFTSDRKIEWDHVIPIVRGGVHAIGNLVPACLTCNRGKSVRLVREWRAGKIVSKASLHL